MKKLLLLVILPVSILADTHYVDLNSLSPTSPYTNWATAATDIQSAVNVVVSNDTVLVADGHYYISSEILVTNAIVIESENGRDTTVVDAQWNCRVFNLQHSACVLSGFTVINGYTVSSGGEAGSGVYCLGASLITNCIVAECTSEGGGGGGICNGHVNNCVIRDNIATYGGGMNGGIANNCVIQGNSSVSHGGGLHYVDANNCLITSNYSGEMGGGMMFNSAMNCTICDNTSVGHGGGIAYAVARNSIIYFNDHLGTKNTDEFHSTEVTYSCSSEVVDGALGNTTANPLFENRSEGNYRIQTNSPCINQGFNPYALTSSDLDGNPRIVNTIVDMGAYEIQTEESMVSIPMTAILEQSSDLHSWTNSGHQIQWVVPVDSTSQFYRVRLEL